MLAFIYVKFILSVAYIVGFYQQLQFYYAQAGHFKINLFLFVENCIYGLMAFVLLWLMFEKKAIYQKMLNVIGIYAFISFAFFALYVFKSTLSPIEYWSAFASQILNVLIIARMYIFKPKICEKKLKKRNVRRDSAHPKIIDYSDVSSGKQQKSELISQQEGLHAHVKERVFEGRMTTAFGRDVKKVRNLQSTKKTKFKRLKKFDLKKI